MGCAVSMCANNIKMIEGRSLKEIPTRALTRPGRSPAGRGRHHPRRTFTMPKIAANSANGQTALADLAEQVRALVDLTDGMLHQMRVLERVPAHNDKLDLRPSKITPDQLLDAWIAARGRKAEAFLLDRIYKRRAARRIAL
jgi:hypothetical protein